MGHIHSNLLKFNAHKRKASRNFITSNSESLNTSVDKRKASRNFITSNSESLNTSVDNPDKFNPVCEMPSFLPTPGSSSIRRSQISGSPLQ